MSGTECHAESVQRGYPFQVTPFLVAQRMARPPGRRGDRWELRLTPSGCLYGLVRWRDGAYAFEMQASDARLDTVVRMERQCPGFDEREQLLCIHAFCAGVTQEFMERCEREEVERLVATQPMTKMAENVFWWEPAAGRSIKSYRSVRMEWQQKGAYELVAVTLVSGGRDERTIAIEKGEAWAGERIQRITLGWIRDGLDLSEIEGMLW